jgi:lipid-A-disaccharide synthase
MRYFLIAGEPSGDQHAAKLMRAIHKEDQLAVFAFFGGDRMERVGGRALVHIRELAFMGFTQLIGHAGRIIRNIRICKKAMVDFRPDVMIAVDYGGFNLRMIRYAKRKGLRVVYYIPPKAWAWRPGRSRILARNCDRVLTILPFEAPFFSRYGVPCEYVGNPVLEDTAPFRRPETGKTRNSLELGDRRIIALLPGSRMQEISAMLPVMLETTRHFNEYQIVVAAHERFPESFYREMAGGLPVKILTGKTLEILGVAEAAMVTSGTATLEAALLRVPQVVCYRTANLSYLIARYLIRVKYISLVNLILDRECVQELIQDGFDPVSAARALRRILEDPVARHQMIQDYEDMMLRLGHFRASPRAAAAVCRLAAGR